MGYLRNTAIFIVILLVWTLSAAAETGKDSAAAVQSEAERGNYRLMDIDELWEKYQDSEADLLLIDTRQDWEFRTGSIESSIHFSMEPTWFSRLIQRGALAQALGSDKEKILVFY